MKKVPFEYGSLAEKENFIDRVEDRRQLKTFLGGGINVMLISPRRWGKSSLVKAAMSELLAEDADVRVCHIDAFTISSEEEFYNKYASAVIQGVSSSAKKRWADFVKFVQSIVPSITLSSDPMNTVSVNLSYRPLKESAESILNLPEKIAIAKKLRVIVCIDEFQQLAALPEWKRMEGTMRSVWQHHHNTTYCLYGSKRHMMMDIFGNSANPFYRFGQLLFIKKIEKEHWLPYIKDNFSRFGKSISDELANRVCDTMECHSWYVQQLCFFLWTHTEKEVTSDIFEHQLQMLIDTNADMFLKDVEGLPKSQIAFLKAVSAGVYHFTAKDVAARYGLGTPNTITKNKKALVQKDILERHGSGFAFVDPLFALWFRREYI
jgi:hypothetical protein